MMDHSLRTISYIADIGDVIVIMARRGPVSPVDGGPRKHQSKICCHVFETDEVCRVYFNYCLSKISFGGGF